MRLDPNLLVPIVMLASVLASAPLVLMFDRQRKRLVQRVEHVSGLNRSADLDRVSVPSIRLARANRTTTASIWFRLFRMPLDLPKANLVPPIAVFAIGILVGAAEWLSASFFISKEVSILTACLSGYMATRWIFSWEFTRYQDKLVRQLPDTIELVVSAARAGLPLAEAFRAITREMPEPTREEFRRVCNEVALGLGVDEALMNVRRRTLVDEYAIFSVTVAVQVRSGGRIAESIQNLAEIVRQRATIKMRGEALAGEAKLSARIMSALPFVGGVIMSILHPGYLTPLFTDPRGKQMFVVGISTLITGTYLMRRIVKSVTKE